MVQAPSVPAQTIAISARHSLTWASLRSRSDPGLESQEGLVIGAERLDPRGDFFLAVNSYNPCRTPRIGLRRRSCGIRTNPGLCDI